MGANKHFKKSAVLNQIKHLERKLEYPSNKDIDFDRTHLNYSLTPKREISPYEYYKKRLSEISVKTERKDINYASGWVVTKPKELDEKYEQRFFEEVYNFLKERYGGEKNVISAEVHKDEKGEPHLHFMFIPVVKNTPNQNMMKVIEYFEKKENLGKNNTEAGRELEIDRKTVRRYRECKRGDVKKEKLSSREVINKKDLITFHSDLEEYLNKKKIPAKIISGITKKNGGNKTVEELKAQEREIER